MLYIPMALIKAKMAQFFLGAYLCNPVIVVFETLTLLLQGITSPYQVKLDSEILNVDLFLNPMVAQFFLGAYLRNPVIVVFETLTLLLKGITSPYQVKLNLEILNVGIFINLIVS